MRSMIALVVASTVFAGGGYWGGYDFTPSRSVALSDDGLALWGNPAGLAWEKGASLDLFGSTAEQTDFPRAWGASARLGPFALGYVDADLGNGMSRRELAIASAFRPVPQLCFGSRLNWMKSDDPGTPDDNSYSESVLYRPWKFLSAGLVLDNPFEYDKGAAPYDQARLTVGLGVRPVRQLMLAVDASVRRDERIDDVEPVFRAEIETLPGLVLRGELDTDERFALGASVSLGNLGVSGETYVADDEAVRSLAHVRFSSARWPTFIPDRKRVVTLDIEGGMPEATVPRFFFGKREHTFGETIVALNEAASDDAVSGLIVKLDSPGLGSAQYEELRAAVLKFRSLDKPTFVYAKSFGNSDYWLASAFDRVVMPPSGHVMLIGLLATHTHLRGTLDKLGITADLVAIGEYKDAGDILTLEYPDTASLSNTEWILDEIDAMLVSGVASGRRVDQGRVREWIDRGGFTVPEAVEAGLVDTTAYPDQIEDVYAALFDDKPSTVGALAYAERERSARTWHVIPRIAVVQFDGEIVDGEGGRGFLTEKSVGDRDLDLALNALRGDDRVVAVVLRVNSPGGSGLASDLVWRALHHMKDDLDVPLVVSMGNVAGSGGYYVSIPGDVVMADSSSITGSIGVIGGKIEMSRLYERIGVTKTIRTRGRFADAWTTARPFSDDERARLTEHLRAFYDDFVAKSAQGRGLSFDAVDSVAGGRVWTGRQARDRRIVDRVGGLWDAITVAKERAGIDPGTEVEVVYFSAAHPEGFVSSLNGTFGIRIPVLSDYEAAQNLFAPLSRGEHMYLTPWSVEIK